MFERFTDSARRVVVLAQEEARMLDHTYIGSEHLLLGLLHEGEGAAARTLQGVGVSLDAARRQVRAGSRDRPGHPEGHFPFNPEAKAALADSLREALRLGDPAIGTEHLLLGLTRNRQARGPQILVGLGAELDDVRTRTERTSRGGPEGGEAAGR